MNNFDLAGAENLSSQDLAEMREGIRNELRILMDATKGDINNEQLERLKAFNEKIVSIDKIWASRKDAEASKPIYPPGMFSYGNGGGAETKTLGDIFVDSPGWRTQTGNRPTFAVNFGEGSVQRFLQTKATMTLSTADADLRRIGPLVLQGAQVPNVLDFVPIEEIRGGALEYLRETSYTNAANVVDEGGAKPEASLALESVPVTPRVVAVHQGVTRQTLQDVSQAREFVNSRLNFMVRAKAEQQILTGTGAASPQQIRGYINVVGIQTESSTVLNSFEKIAIAIDKVRVSGHTEANAIVMHPTNFLTIQSTYSATDGQFIYQHPAQAGPRTLWGVPVILTTGMTLNSALVGDFANFSRVYTVGGVISEIGYKDADFTNNILRFLVEMRLDLAVFRPAAFCLVTNLT